MIKPVDTSRPLSGAAEAQEAPAPESGLGFAAVIPAKRTRHVNRHANAGEQAPAESPLMGAAVIQPIRRIEKGKD